MNSSERGTHNSGLGVLDIYVVLTCAKVDKVWGPRLENTDTNFQPYFRSQGPFINYVDKQGERGVKGVKDTT